jgi:hypothetical protein
MIDYVILEGANGTSVYLDPTTNVYPMQNFDMQYASRNDQTDKVQQDGQWETYDYLGRMTLHIDGNILGDSPWDYWEKRMAFTSVFNPVSALGFKWTVNARVKFTGISEEVSTHFNLDGKPDIPINSQYPANSPFTVSLTAPDPRFYGTQQTFQTGQPIAVGGLTFPLTFPLSFGSLNTGGDAFLSNSGNATTYPEVIIYGPASSPSLTIDNADGTQTILQLGASGGLSVGDGDYIIVDMKYRTVQSSLGANLFQYVSGTWWFLQPGINHVRFNCLDSSPDTSAVFAWSNAYLF